MSATERRDGEGSAALSREAVQPGQPRVLGRRGVAPAAEAPGASALPVRQVWDEAALAAAVDQARREGEAHGHELGLRDGQARASREELQVGYEEGLQRGLAEGRAQAAEDARRRLLASQQEAEARLQRLDALHDAFAQGLREQLVQRLAAAEDDMVALCHEALCRVFGAAALDRSLAAEAVRTAVAAWLQGGAGESATLALHVHPDDLAMLQSDEALAAWIKRQGQRGVVWQADAEVAWGGCVVRSTRQGRLDARLETQFAALQAWMQEARGG